MKYDSALCTLNSVIEQLKLDATLDVSVTSAQQVVINAEEANTIAYLKRLITGVSGIIENDQQRTFVPYRDSVVLDARYIRTRMVYNVVGWELETRDDLLSITSITWLTTLLAAADYRLATPDDFPNRYIMFDPQVVSMPASFDDTVTIVGVWGYNRNPDDMWISATTINNVGGYSASATALIVTSVAALQTYQYIQIGTETLLITAIVNLTLTVERGVRGSTAATIAHGTTISRYRQHPEVEQVARRLVIRLFQNRGEVGDLIVIGDGAYKINTEQIKLDLKRKTFTRIL